VRQKEPSSSLLLLSRLEWERRIWFVHNAGLTVFHHHNASLWGRDFSSLYADIKALGRVVMKNFSNRDTIIHPHMKIVDGTFLYLLYNLIVHRTSSFLKVLIGCMLSFAVSIDRVEDIVCDASRISKRCASKAQGFSKVAKLWYLLLLIPPRCAPRQGLWALVRRAAPAPIDPVEERSEEHGVGKESDL
jgi:hypothetical protein